MAVDARDERLRAWNENGFFVRPRLFDANAVRELSETCDHVLARLRAESASVGHSSRFVSGLLAPEHYAARPELLTRLVHLASSGTVLGLIHDLGLPHEGTLSLRTAQYFHEPSARDYDGEWHRDGDEVQMPGVERGGVPEVPATRLRFRIALAHDDHLEIVPGSHRRADTSDELRIRRARLRDDLANAVRVELDPGDACVFDRWTIHRGRYRRQTIRRTLDLVYGFGTPTMTTTESTLRIWRDTLRKLRVSG